MSALPTGSHSGGAFDREVAMTNLYPQILCPACGQSHALYRPADTRGRSPSYSYVCPHTGVIVVCCPDGGLAAGRLGAGRFRPHEVAGRL